MKKERMEVPFSYIGCRNAGGIARAVHFRRPDGISAPLTFVLKVEHSVARGGQEELNRALSSPGWASRSNCRKSSWTIERIIIKTLLDIVFDLFSDGRSSV